MKKSQLRNIIRESIKQLLTEQSQWTREDVSFPVWRRCTTKPGCSGGTRDGGCDEGTKCKKDSDCGWNTCCKCKTYYKNPTGKEAPPDGYERKRR